METKKNTFPLRLEKDLMEKLKKLADANRRPITTEISIAIEQYIEEERLEREKTLAFKTAMQMNPDELCKVKIFAIAEDDKEVVYEYSNFPGVYEVTTSTPDSLTLEKTYKVITNSQYNTELYPKSIPM